MRGKVTLTSLLVALALGAFLFEAGTGQEGKGPLPPGMGYDRCHGVSCPRDMKLTLSLERRCTSSQSTIECSDIHSSNLYRLGFLCRDGTPRSVAQCLPCDGTNKCSVSAPSLSSILCGDANGALPSISWSPIAQDVLVGAESAVNVMAFVIASSSLNPKDGTVRASNIEDLSSINESPQFYWLSNPPRSPEDGTLLLGNELVSDALSSLLGGLVFVNAQFVTLPLLGSFEDNRHAPISSSACISGSEILVGEMESITTSSISCASLPAPSPADSGIDSTKTWSHSIDTNVLKQAEKVLLQLPARLPPGERLLQLFVVPNTASMNSSAGGNDHMLYRIVPGTTKITVSSSPTSMEQLIPRMHDSGSEELKNTADDYDVDDSLVATWITDVDFRCPGARSVVSDILLRASVYMTSHSEALEREATVGLASVSAATSPLRTISSGDAASKDSTAASATGFISCGVLLYGPSGVGKSTLARAIGDSFVGLPSFVMGTTRHAMASKEATVAVAAAARVGGRHCHNRCFLITAPDLFRGAAGESEARLNRLLEEATASSAFCEYSVRSAAQEKGRGVSHHYSCRCQSLIILEDADVLIPSKRGSSREPSASWRRPLSERISEMLVSAITKKHCKRPASNLPSVSPFWLAIASNPSRVSSEALGEGAFLQPLRFPLPDPLSRLQILKHLLGVDDTPAATAAATAVATSAATTAAVAAIDGGASCHQERSKEDHYSEAAASSGGDDAIAISSSLSIITSALSTHGFTPAHLVSLVSEAVDLKRRGMGGGGKGSAPPPPPASFLAEALQHVARPIVIGAAKVPDSFLVPSTASSSSRTTSSTLFDQVMEAVCAPLLHGADYTWAGISPPRGILIHGPSGTGKTSAAFDVARVIRSRSLANVLSINAADCISALVGASEAAVATIFAQARELSPCLIVIDQFEVFASKRQFQRSGDGGSAAQTTSSSSHAMDRLLSVLLTEMDGIAGGSTQSPSMHSLKSSPPSSSSNSAVGLTGDKLTPPEVSDLETMLHALGVSDCVQIGNHRRDASGKEMKSPSSSSAITSLDTSSFLRRCWKHSTARHPPLSAEAEKGGKLRSLETLVSSAVIVLAITSDISALDPAILRPGRLDVHLEASLPNSSTERAALLSVFFSQSPRAVLSKEVDGKALSTVLTTSGSGMDGDIADCTRRLIVHGTSAATESLAWSDVYDSIAVVTSGWSQSDLKSLWEEAALACLRRYSHTSATTLAGDALSSAEINVANDVCDAWRSFLSMRAQ